MSMRVETKTMRRRLILVSTCLVVGFACTLWLQANPPATRIDQASEEVLMHSKLTSSQRVLEGLVAKDFELVARGAREMMRISEAAEWPRPRDAVYEHFSAQFRRQCNRLEDLAKKRNHEGVSFTYLHLTTTCIQCHDYVRDSQRIAEPHPRGNVQAIPSQWPEHNRVDFGLGTHGGGSDQ